MDIDRGEIISPLKSTSVVFNGEIISPLDFAIMELSKTKRVDKLITGCHTQYYTKGMGYYEHV